MPNCINNFQYLSVYLYLKNLKQNLNLLKSQYVLFKICCNLLEDIAAYVCAHTQSCPKLCDRWAIALQAPPSMGFSMQEYWSGVPFPSPGYLPSLGIEPMSLCFLNWKVDSLPLHHLALLSMSKPMCINDYKENFKVLKLTIGI